MINIEIRRTFHSDHFKLQTRDCCQHGSSWRTGTLSDDEGAVESPAAACEVASEGTQKEFDQYQEAYV